MVIVVVVGCCWMFVMLANEGRIGDGAEIVFLTEPVFCLLRLADSHVTSVPSVIFDEIWQI